MISSPNRALLPAGLSDLLPPDAGHAASIVERLHASFAGRGYQRVKPPLVEFEQSLLDGAGAAMSSETFRLMDPVSQEMMGLRADMTLQIARIASTRLNKAPRPLRLSYSGDVLRVRGKQLRPERQFSQIGAELIGVETASADVEVILLALDSLAALGVSGLAIDLALPTLVPAVCAGLDIAGEAAIKLRDALDRKDAAAVAGVAAESGDDRHILNDFMAAAGSAAGALAALEKLPLSAEARAGADRLADVAHRVLAARSDVKVTVDPVENRGFEYHTGVSLTLFARGVRGEMGAGGRYLAGQGIEGRATEPATGFTLYLDTILRAIAAPEVPPTLFLPLDVSRDDAEHWREQGWITIAALDDSASDRTSARAEAARLGCSHILVKGEPVAIDAG